MTRERLAAASSITLALLLATWIVLMGAGVHIDWPR